MKNMLRFVDTDFVFLLALLAYMNLADANQLVVLLIGLIALIGGITKCVILWHQVSEDWLQIKLKKKQLKELP